MTKQSTDLTSLFMPAAPMKDLTFMLIICGRNSVEHRGLWLVAGVSPCDKLKVAAFRRSIFIQKQTLGIYSFKFKPKGLILYRRKPLRLILHLFLYIFKFKTCAPAHIYVKTRHVIVTYRNEISSLAQTLVSSTRLSPASSFFSNCCNSSKFSPWRSSPLTCLLSKVDGISISKTYGKIILHVETNNIYTLVAGSYPPLPYSIWRYYHALAAKDKELPIKFYIYYKL